ncbi:MAG TPA: HAD-IA family hydrolase, partial [Acidimicrobiales bacterium]|nr:HAD-IA family hydrolase [Acidimicrobiales bacterium]
AESGVTVPMARVHRLIGKSGDDLLDELADGPDERISRAHARHFRESRALIHALPGARGLLQRVHDEGHMVVIVTSAEEEELELLLAPLGCESLLDEIVHGEAVDAAKPAPDLFDQALSRTSLSPDRVVTVGDTGWDVEAAHRADIACVGVETGGVAACELLEAGADAVYASCAALLEDYERSPLGTLGQPGVTEGTQETQEKGQSR